MCFENGFNNFRSITDKTWWKRKAQKEDTHRTHRRLWGEKIDAQKHLRRVRRDGAFVHLLRMRLLGAPSTKAFNRKNNSSISLTEVRSEHKFKKCLEMLHICKRHHKIVRKVLRQSVFEALPQLCKNCRSTLCHAAPREISSAFVASEMYEKLVFKSFLKSMWESHT